MKLNSSILEEVIREVISESTDAPSTLGGGAGVQQGVLKKGMRQSGEEIAQIEDFTPQEGKIIQRYIGLLQKAAEELSLDKGTLFTLLNAHFKKLSAAVDDELSKKPDTPNPIDEQCGPPIPGPAVAVSPAAEGGEGRMAKSQLYKASTYAAELEEMIEDGEELDSWVQSKITKASDYLSSVKHYLEYKKLRGN